MLSSKSEGDMPKKFGSEEEKREYFRNIMAKWRERNPEKVEAAKPAAAIRTAEWLKNPANWERNRKSMQRIRAEHKAADPIGFREREKKRNTLLRVNLRIRIIKAYGGFCTCCGEKRFEFLTFDHMDGNGAKHRKENKLRAPYTFLLWVWSDGNLQKHIRLLCFNCNCSMGFLGYCPHQRERTENQLLLLSS